MWLTSRSSCIIVAERECKEVAYQGPHAVPAAELIPKNEVTVNLDLPSYCGMIETI